MSTVRRINRNGLIKSKSAVIASPHSGYEAARKATRARFPSTNIGSFRSSTGGRFSVAHRTDTSYVKNPYKH